MSRLFKKIIKFGSIGTAVGTSAYLLQRNDWDVSSVGAVRFGRAAFTAVGIVIDYKLNLKGPDKTSPEYLRLKSQIHRRSALKLRDMCCANGGVFIKVGQHVGSLEYLLPIEYVETMTMLHNDAPKSHISDLYRVIEEDLGKKVDDLFVDFSREPLGAASLAQVHKATLKDGRVVAVKVQHPKVKGHSYVDMKTMEFLINCVSIIFPGFQYMWLAEETKRNLPKELDFLHEGRNCETVERLFKHFSFLKIPKIYWDLSSERVLTMEFCEGGKVDDRKYMEDHGISISEVTRNLGKLYSEMIFVQGYVHCDPHPGNVFVNKTKRGTEIVLLDHGLYQTLTDDFRVNYCKMWMSLINADLDGIKKYSATLNCGKKFGLLACMLTARSWDSIVTGINKKQFSSNEDDEIKNNAALYLIEISEILNSIPRQMLLLLKTNDVLRSIETTLKTRANATSFINMSRCCVRAVTSDDLRNSDSVVQSLKLRLKCQWQLFVIRLYEISLWFKSSSFGLFFIKNGSLNIS